MWNYLKSVIPLERLHQIKRERLISAWGAEISKYLRYENASHKKSGLNLIGDFTAGNGLGEAARNSLKALQTTKVPYALLSYKSMVPAHQSFPFQFGSFDTNFSYRTNLFHVNPLEFPDLWHKFSHRDLTNHYSIGSWYWELPEFPDKWTSTFNLVDEIWVASDFVKQSIQKKTIKPVIKIPPSIQVAVDPTITRESLGLPDEQFLFLCAFDTLSMLERKNPLAVIEAFMKAFSPDELSIGLVIKINNAAENEEKVAELKRTLINYSNCYFIEEVFSRNKFNSLINLVDVYVSLHHSEGFGLIPAEAMYLGKPVIMTNWSGNTEFITNDNCCPVHYRLIPLSTNYGDYEAGQVWAEPDVDHAALYMVKLSSDRSYYNNISSNAKIFIRNNYSPEVIGRLIQKRLLEIDQLLDRETVELNKEIR